MTTGTLFAFNYLLVSNAPALAGVYVLHQHGQVIYIGKAERSIRTRLVSHFNGSEGPCTQSATHFEYELSSSPAAREKQLLQQYVARFGRLPRCNDRMP